jgi:hypothetical protein
MLKVSNKVIKNKPKKSNISTPADVPADIPPDFLCDLCRRPMSDPVQSIYGNRFEYPVISKWLSQQGRICPITGTYTIKF